jgi:hypothetical protein
MSATEDHTHLSGAVQQAPGLWRTQLRQHDLSIPGREVVQQRVDIGPEAPPVKHTHPGEEVIHILEGALEYQIEGQPAKTCRAVLAWRSSWAVSTALLELPGSHRRGWGALARSGISGSTGQDRRGLESFDHEVDAKRQLPDEFRDCRDDLRCGARLEDVEQHSGPRGDDQRTSDEPQDRHAPRYEARSVHQVAQDQPVPDADDPARPEQERPVVDRDERPADRNERTRTACASDVPPQRHDRKEANDPGSDEGAFDNTGGDIAQGEALVLPLENREQHDGRSDVGDNEDHFEERPEGDAAVSARADDVIDVIQHRAVEKERRWDRSEKSDQEKRACNKRKLSSRVHLESFHQS